MGYVGVAQSDAMLENMGSIGERGMRWYNKGSVDEHAGDAGIWQTLRGEEESYLRVTVSADSVRLLVVEKEDRSDGKNEGHILAFSRGEFTQFLQVAQSLAQMMTRKGDASPK